MNDPATRRVDLHSIDGQPFQPEQARRVGDDTLETLGQIQLIMRTLGQARDLALVTMNCRHSHDHRGHGSPTSTTHQTPLPAQVRRAAKGLYYDAYVMIDIYSRYIVGAHVHATESGPLAEEMMKEVFGVHGIPQVVHADRGTSMTSKTVATLLADLQVTRSHSRPKVSNDNPYSEA